MSATAGAQDAPRIPYYSWDACPFECCTYRRWKAEESVSAFARRDGKGQVAFQIKKGEWVSGVGGVVITYRAGVSKILKPIQVGYLKRGDKPVLRLKPGDTVYPLHHQGEGFSLFWYKGRVYSDEVSAHKPDADPPDPALNVQALVIPEYVWWAKVRNRHGAMGWTDQLGKFSNVDACG